MLPLRRVLVVDDDQMMRDLLHALLPLHGFEVHSVADGGAAIETLHTDTHFDLLLLDLHMHGLEGRELVEALRASAPRQTLVVGMSGSATDAPTREVLDAFLRKPFDAAGLERAIAEARQYLSTGAANRQAPASNDSLPDDAPERLNPLDNSIFDSLSKVIPIHQLGQLYELTLNDIAKRLERIRHAAGAGDLHSAQREAHAIKGSCGMVGAAELQSLAAAIEGDTTVNTSAIAQIPSACLRLRRMLDAKLQPA